MQHLVLFSWFFFPIPCCFCKTFAYLINSFTFELLPTKFCFPLSVSSLLLSSETVLSSTRIEGTLGLLFLLRCVDAALRALKGRRSAQSSLWITVGVLVLLVLQDRASCPAHLQRALAKSSSHFRSHWPAWQSFLAVGLEWNPLLPDCRCIPVVQRTRIWFLWVAENKAWYWELNQFISSFNGIVFLPLCIKKTHAHGRGRFHWRFGGWNPTKAVIISFIDFFSIDWKQHNFFPLCSHCALWTLHDLFLPDPW